MTVGHWRCVCADAREERGYDEALGGARADVLLTDPPYCLLTRRRKGGDLRDPKGRKIDRDPVVRFESVRAYRAFTAEWLPKAIARLRSNAPVVIWTNFLGKDPIRATAAKHGYGHVVGEYTWAKRTREANASEVLLRAYEVALVLSTQPARPLSAEESAMPVAVVSGYDDDAEGDHWGSHPHHKPFGVLEPLVRAYSKPGDRVLDPFAGSGSIPEAALRLERIPVSLERSSEWADRVTERLNARVGQR